MATAVPMRVMQLGSPTGLYGAERWILALIRHLDPAVVFSIVGSIRDEPRLSAPVCAEAEASGFLTKIFDAYGRINWLAISQVRRFLLENELHILHTHGYKTDIIGLLATRGTPCRLVSTPHGWSANAGLKLTVYEAIDRAIFPLFDAVAPLSDALHEGLRKIPGLRRKLHLIRNGVDIAEIDREDRLAEDINTWRAKGYFIVGYIGQLIPRKGLLSLLDAFARLATSRKRLVILGEGPQREELEAAARSLGIQDDVMFLGFREDRLTFLKGFDVFVLPSRLEGIPRCLMEAMAAKVPIVASDIPGCRDLVKPGETGLLCHVDSVDSLLGCLQAFLDQELRARLGENGRNFVLANYSAKAMAKQYENLYATLSRTTAYD